jgi:hypothetical protein
VSKLNLILAFHNHQPVGNFDEVLEDCYAKSYLPFLQVLLDHPGLKVVLHYSGYLLAWMKEKHPEALAMIRTLVTTGRAEILSGGFYEPILSVLPEMDRMLQVTEFSGFIKEHLGYASKGMWLAERVWEPRIPRFIAEAGMRYLPVDDYHFKLTGLEEEDLFGYYVTEDEGRTVSVFPGSEKLRYFIPFRPVEEILSYLRDVGARGGSSLLTMADDGEKFGVWPGTYKHCYEDGWLHSFFSALEENSDWIATTTFARYHAQFPPLGRVYLPTASYREMGEWALPARAALEYERVAEEMAHAGGERFKQLLRGGIWRSFMVKYPEANHIHKRMLMVSGKVHEALKAEKSKVKSRKSKVDSEKSTPHNLLHELWKGQCNDAYWHGIFGGLYLPHLRSALYRHLLRAESEACKMLKRCPFVECRDFDCDGFEDIVAVTTDIILSATERGGSLTELSLPGFGVNIFDTLSRRPEAYHSKIAEIAEAGSDTTRTIHDQLSVREAGLSDYLVYDGYRRSSFLDRFLREDAQVEDMMRSRCEELGDFTDGVYSMGHSVKGADVSLSFEREGWAGQRKTKIRKTLVLKRGRELRADYLVEGAFDGLFAVEMNISLLGSPLAMITAGGTTETVRSTSMHSGIREFRIEDSFLGLAIEGVFNESIDLWYYPVETISLSEQGIERLYQGTCLLLIVKPDQHGSRHMGLTLRFVEEKR